MRMLLPFGLVEEEVARKLESMVATPDDPVAEFMGLLGNRCGASAVETAERMIDCLNELPSVSKDHPSMQSYLAHPVRVAHFVLSAMTQPALDTVLTALLHNLFEFSGLAEDDLWSWRLPKTVPQHIRLLTIDRSREAEIPYLMEFYGAIEAAGEGLALVRCMDKIDNLFGSQIIDDSRFRREYIELADRFLTPMATRLETSFGKYFSETCAFARAAPYLDDKKRQIDAFVRSKGTTT